MGKIAFLFAGQGAQYPGMGKELCECSPAAARIFDLAEQIRPGTKAQCFSGDKEELTKTANTQPCIFAVSLAAAAALAEKGVTAQGAAGFSLGEMTALTFARAFSADQGFSLVCERGKLMQAANQEHPGAMAAVLKLKNQQVEALCSRFQQVYPVNYNCEGQLVVAGAPDEMQSFCAAAAEAGGRAKLLAVGGGFHSPFMTGASGEFLSLLESIPMNMPEIPVYANLTGEPYGADLKNTLASQMANPVLWQKAVEVMAAHGFDTFVEVGPGQTLTGLCKRIAPQARLFHVENRETLEQAVQGLLA